MRAFTLFNRQSNFDSWQSLFTGRRLFGEFEESEFCHRWKQGGALTARGVKGEYRKLLEAYFGEAMAIDSFTRFRSLRISHFYQPFMYKNKQSRLSAAVTLYQRRS